MVAIGRWHNHTADGFARYLSLVAEHRPISPEREQELARRFKETGDSAAVQQLMLANLRFVIKIALEYRKYGCDLNDLVQEGNLGLAEAIQRFDPERGNRLVTYAAWWIRDRVRTRIARSRSVSARGTTRAERRLRFDHPETGSSMRDLPLECVDPARLSTSDGPDDQLMKRQETERLKRAIEEGLRGLDSRERQIAEMRLMAETPVSLSALGEYFGVSRERARQLAERARKKLEVGLRKQGFS